MSRETEFRSLHKYRIKVFKCKPHNCKKLMSVGCAKCESESTDLKIKFFSNFTRDNIDNDIARSAIISPMTVKDLFSLQFEFPELVRLYKKRYK